MSAVFMLRESTGKKSIASEPMSLIADCLVSLAWLDTAGLLRLNMKTVGRPHTIISYFIKINLTMWYLLIDKVDLDLDYS